VTPAQANALRHEARCIQMAHSLRAYGVNTLADMEQRRRVIHQMLTQANQPIQGC